jgi:glycosyltransferase involved in cell wall biosynthesis
MKKKKILFLTENRATSSGFGTYAKELLPRIHKTNKYEIAELYCYGDPHQFNKNNDWLVYSNPPLQNEENFKKAYSNKLSQWGLDKFDRVLLDFKPDIVATYRDPWMDSFISHSSLRPFFHWVWMPTVDSSPQKTEWLHWFQECDALLAYTEFGVETIKKQTNNRLCPIDIAPAAFDDVFDIIEDKNEHKAKHNIPLDSFIVGTVMRNQKRKHFADLMLTFSNFIRNSDPEIAKKCFLYIHTSHPELHGWDITKLIHEYNLGSKVYVSYSCQACGSFFPSKYRDAITVCNKCGKHAAVLPGVSRGISRETLKEIYNLFDLYVQYANCEGQGMPQIEAAACGVPVATVRYSAMEYIGKNIEAFMIEPYLMRELETNADRSGPNNEHLEKIFNEVVGLSKEEYNIKRNRTYNLVREHYSWDKTCSAWCNVFDMLNTGDTLNWDHPPIIKNPEEAPKGLSNFMFMEWIYNNYLQKPDALFNYEMLDLLKSLNHGLINRGEPERCTQENILNNMRNLYNRRIWADRARVGQIQYEKDPFILQAYRSMKKDEQ